MGDVTWREYLGQLLSDPQELKKAAAQLRVRERTIKRWVENENSPRESMLGEIASLFQGQEKQQMISLMQQDFPDFTTVETGKQTSISLGGKGLSPDLYDEILNARLQTPRKNRFFVVCHLVLRPMLEELDPSHQGVFIGISQCQTNGKEIVALRERVEFGTPPWTTNLTPASLVGRESLTGHAVLMGRLQIVQDVTSSSYLLPLRKEPHAKSTAAIPIFGSPDCIAGCVTIHGSQRNYFSPERISLITKYARLISLAFSDDDFCQKDLIRLQMMQEDELQAKLYTAFRARVTQIIDTMKLGYEDAEKEVWRQMVKEASYT